MAEMAGGGNNVRRTVVKLGAITAGMFGMAFALVPVYNWFCDATGVNGKAADAGYTGTAADIDASRTVDVQFVAANSAGMAWQVQPVATSVEVHPGEVGQGGFNAHNPTDRAIVGHAVTSVQPARAAAHVHKTRCFCFADQRIDAGATKQLQFAFVVDRQLPRDVHTITLAWTLFDATGRVAAAM